MQNRLGRGSRTAVSALHPRDMSQTSKIRLSKSKLTTVNKMMTMYSRSAPSIRQCSLNKGNPIVPLSSKFRFSHKAKLIDNSTESNFYPIHVVEVNNLSRNGHRGWRFLYRWNLLIRGPTSQRITIITPPRMVLQTSGWLLLSKRQSMFWDEYKWLDKFAARPLMYL